MKKIYIIFLLITFFFSGCYSETTLPAKTVTPKAVKVTATAQEKRPNNGTLFPAEITPIKTPISPSDTPTMKVTAAGSITATAAPKVQIIKDISNIPTCSSKGISEKPGPGFGISGTIIYETDQHNRLYTIGGTPLKRGNINIQGDQPIIVFGVSPDGKWLAYSSASSYPNNTAKFDHPSIVLLGVDGERIEHTLDVDWLNQIDQSEYQLQYFVGGYWLNTNMIFTFVISRIPFDHPYFAGLYYPVLLDPFLGNWNMKAGELLPELNGISSVAFSPDMRRIISDSNGIQMKEEVNGNGALLWSDKDSIFSANASVEWAPDSSWVVFASRDLTNKDTLHLYLVSRDGKDIKEIDSSRIGKFFKFFYWSPNSRYFAYISRYVDNQDHLLVFDNSQNRFILDCPISNSDQSSAELIWSPDNTWIAISQEKKPMRILNIITGQEVELSVIGKAVGWSDQFK